MYHGAVGRPEILDELRRLAPLTAVRGNVDRGPWADALPEATTVTVDGVVIHVRHIGEEVDRDPGVADVVVVGHSHRPTCARRGDALWLNPGSAGPRRFRLPVTVAILSVDGGEASAELVTLDV